MHILLDGELPRAGSVIHRITRLLARLSWRLTPKGTISSSAAAGGGVLGATAAGALADDACGVAGAGACGRTGESDTGTAAVADGALA